MTGDTTVERTGAPAEPRRCDVPASGRSDCCWKVRLSVGIAIATSTAGLVLLAVAWFAMGPAVIVGCLIGSMVGMVGGQVASDILAHDSDCVGDKDQDRHRAQPSDHCPSCGTAMNAPASAASRSVPNAPASA